MLAAETLSDWRVPLDEAIYRAVNGIGSPVLDAIFVGASSQAFGLAALAVMAAWVIVKFRRSSPLALVLLGVIIGFTDRFGHVVIKPFVGRMRPCFAMKDEAIRVLVGVSNVGSMPSLHSANAFAVATAMALLVPRAGWFVYPVAALIALSRVGVGVHWPSDIVGGALFGTAVSLVVILLARRFLPLPAALIRPRLGATVPPVAPPT